MEFAFTMQCFFHRPNDFLVRRAMNVVHLPTDFSISTFYRKLFIVIFADKAKNEKDLQAPHIGT